MVRMNSFGIRDVKNGMIACGKDDSFGIGTTG
jgi:hypothetical protein